MYERSPLSRVFHLHDGYGPIGNTSKMLQAGYRGQPCQTTSFLPGSNRGATTKSSRRHSCPSLRRRAELQPPIAAPRRTKRGSGLKSKLLRSVFRWSGPTARRPDGDDLPRHPRPSRLSGRSRPARRTTSRCANMVDRRGRRLAPEGASGTDRTHELPHRREGLAWLRKSPATAGTTAGQFPSNQTAQNTRGTTEDSGSIVRGYPGTGD